MAQTIKIDYSRFKASGVYTLEFDASESIQLNTQTTRLVVGFSRKGPFNAPVYLPDKKAAKNVYGDIDRFLERRGSFFHRALLTCLDVGPVFGLNLMALNNDPDTGDYVPYTSYSLAATERNGRPVNRLYASFYNKERFWFPDQEYLLANVNAAGSINEGKLLNIVNLSQAPVSIIIRKATVNGFDVTAREWYGVGNIPPYLDDYDFISDYFVDIFVVGGKWDDYRRLAIDPTFSEYFDIRGLKKDKFREFLGAPEVNVISSFTGTVIPDFTDGRGIVHSVDVLMNQALATSGVFCAIDRAKLEKYDPSFAGADDTDTTSAVDMVGHQFANPERENPEIIDFLSYRTTIKEAINFQFDNTINYYRQPEGGVILNIGQPITTRSEKKGNDFGYLNNVVRIKKPNDEATLFTQFEWGEIYAGVVPGSSMIRLDAATEKWGLIQTKEVRTEINSDTDAIEEVLELRFTHPNKAKETLFKPVTFTLAIPTPQNLIDFPYGVLDRIPVRLASVGTNINIASLPVNIDGVALANGDRILLKDQTDKRENGVYVVDTVLMTATRSVDLNQTNELAYSSFFYVTDGVINFGKGFALLTKNATIDIDDLDFVEYTKPALNFIKSLMPRQYTQPGNDVYADPAWWPQPGQDFLLENKVKKLYYYVKALETPVYLDSGNRVQINLDLNSIPALQRIATNPFGFLATVHAEENAKLVLPQIVFRPDMFKWVSPVGNKGGINLSSVVSTLGIQSITIARPLAALPNQAVGDNMTALDFDTTAFYPRTVNTQGSTGTIRIENTLSGEVRFLQVKKNVSLGDYTNTLTERQLVIQLLNNSFLADITVPSDWVASWDFPEACHFVAYKYSKLHEYFDASVMLPGDQFYFSTDAFYNMDYVQSADADGIPILKVYGFDQFNTTTLNFDNFTSRGVASGFFMTPSNHWLRGGLLPFDANDPEEGGIWIYGEGDKLYDPVDVLSWNTTKTSFVIRNADQALIQVGQYIVSEHRDNDNLPIYKLTRVVRKRRLADGSGFEYTLNLPAKIDINGTLATVTRYLPFEDFISNYQFTHLAGFKLTDFHLPGGINKAAQLEKILGMLDPGNSNLQEVLAEKDLITFRYIVDTFDGAIGPMTGPKVHLTRTAARRQKCMALMNAPSIQEFIDSNDPRFTEEPTRVDPKPILNTAYIATGGNLALGPQNTFTLPDENNGAKFSGYFTPFLVIRENGRNIKIPPAADVSNLFVQKFINGTPFAIVAGLRRGVLSNRLLVGLEYDFITRDRENLEPFGLNPIVKKRGVGFMIFGNQMTYQKTRSAFNNLHVRDLLITLEEAVETILENYLFEFNDASTRLEIKTIVDSYLDGVRAAGGIYAFQTTMDESNNTPEIIDQNLGIIDIAIEPARGIHKFINRVTVMRTGGIASGGFINFV